MFALEIRTENRYVSNVNRDWGLPIWVCGKIEDRDCPRIIVRRYRKIVQEGRDRAIRRVGLQCRHSGRRWRSEDRGATLPMKIRELIGPDNEQFVLDNRSADCTACPVVVIGWWDLK